MQHFSAEHIGVLSRQYREEGYVTFGQAAASASPLAGNADVAVNAHGIDTSHLSTDGAAVPHECHDKGGDGQSFLEAVVGVSLADARAHLDDCVLNSNFDLAGETHYRPTKLPPEAYVAELRPLVEAAKAEAEAKAKAAEEAEAKARALTAAGPDAPPLPAYKKKEKAPKKPPRYNGKARRTVHAIDVHVCDSVFRRLAASPAIGELVGALTGWTAEGAGVRLLETQVWMKPPRCTVPLAFHRDTPYFGFLSPLDICTVWLTFDDVATEERAKELGGLEYAVGSHLWSQVGGIEGVFFDRDYRSPMKKAAAGHRAAQSGTIPPSASVSEGAAAECPETKRLRAEASAAVGSSAAPGVVGGADAAPLFDIHYVCVPAGGASFHNGMLWHGSGANLSDTEWRRGIGIHYIRSDAAFKPEYAVYDDEAVEEGEGDEASEEPKKRPFLSAMWAPHKRKGTLSLCDERFPIIWPPSTPAQQ